MTQVNFAKIWDGLLAEGRSSITAAELEDRTGATQASVYMAAKYAIDHGRLFSPVRGLYVVVTPEHRTRGVVPATHFIDPMMKHLGADYYIAYASAAEWWGAAHQAPQEFQVAVTKRVRDRQIGRVRLRFHVVKAIDARGVRRLAGPRTTITVATPDLCAVDLAGRPELGGGLGNVATIFAELPDLHVQEIVRLASSRPRAAARRLGWLLELVRPDLGLDALRDLAEPHIGQPTLLAPKGARRGELNRSWSVIVNAAVEPDEL